MITNGDKPVFFGREDTMLGICEAIGQDFGFSPTWLRAGLGLTLVLSPLAVTASYFALGVLVLISRLLIPAPNMAAEAQRVEASVIELRQPLPVDAEPERIELALAA